jgi:small subunit ribosomal protein S4
VTIPSFRVKPGQVIGLRDGSPVRPAAADAAELLARVAGWLETDPDALVGRVLRNPGREDIHVPVDEQLVVEHFSRR